VSVGLFDGFCIRIHKVHHRENPRADLHRKHTVRSRPWDTRANLRPRGTVGDLSIFISITHPLSASGVHPDGTTKVASPVGYQSTSGGPACARTMDAKKRLKHSNYFHHGFFMVPLIASTSWSPPPRLFTFSLEFFACRPRSSRYI